LYLKGSAKNNIAVLTLLIFILSMVSAAPVQAAGLTFREGGIPESSELISDTEEGVFYRIKDPIDPENVYLRWNLSNGMDANLQFSLDQITLKNKDADEIITLNKEIGDSYTPETGTTIWPAGDFKYTKEGGGDGSGGTLRQIELTLQSTDLQQSTNYIIILGPEMKANNGNTLGKPYSWEFVTSGSSDFTYTISDNEAAITGYTGSDRDVIIPDTIIEGGTSYPVTAIGNSVFYNCTDLTSITLPDGLTSLGESVFENCTDLTSITLPDGLTSLNNYVFYNCTSLTSITLPDGMISLGNNVFTLCTSLTSITLPAGLTSLGNGVFSGCTGLASVTIPDGVTKLFSQVFYGCTGLSSLTLPEALTHLGNNVFYGCINLTSITLPAGLTSLGNGVFSGCTGLNAIYFLGSQPSVFGTDIFANTATDFALYHHVTQADSWSGFTTCPTEAFCTLTLDLQIGSTPESSYVVVDSDGNIAAPADPIREDYTFDGWYKEAACINLFSFGNETVADNVTLYAGWTEETSGEEKPVYTVIPVADAAYTISETQLGIRTMTVNTGFSGFKYFSVNISPVIAHNGDETAVFVHLRDEIQLGLNAARADFDLVSAASAGFNVLAGDLIKVYVVDNLNSTKDFNPTIYQ
jgi:uncharacterized repeat protein (TIGR02543 family)